jgi:hypothetical protein
MTSGKFFHLLRLSLELKLIYAATFSTPNMVDANGVLMFVSLGIDVQTMQYMDYFCDNIRSINGTNSGYLLQPTRAKMISL